MSAPHCDMDVDVVISSVASLLFFQHRPVSQATITTYIVLTCSPILFHMAFSKAGSCLGWLKTLSGCMKTCEAQMRSMTVAKRIIGNVATLSRCWRSTLRSDSELIEIDHVEDARETTKTKSVTFQLEPYLPTRDTVQARRFFVALILAICFP